MHPLLSGVSQDHLCSFKTETVNKNITFTFQEQMFWGPQVPIDLDSCAPLQCSSGSGLQLV